MTEQLTFDHDGNVLEMFDALVKESELYEQGPAYRMQHVRIREHREVMENRCGT